MTLPLPRDVTEHDDAMAARYPTPPTAAVDEPTSRVSATTAATLVGVAVFLAWLAVVLVLIG